MASSGGLQKEMEDASNMIENLRVTDLKEICRSIQVGVSGRKSELQDRIRQFIKQSMSKGHIDPWRPKAIIILARKALLNEDLPSYEQLWLSLRSGAFAHPVATGHAPVEMLGAVQANIMGASAVRPNSLVIGPGGNTTTYAATRSANTRSKNPNLRTPFTCRAAIFYKVKKVIEGSGLRLKQHNGRERKIVSFKVNNADMAYLKQDPHHRVYLFCGLFASLTSADGDKTIEFPLPNEITINNTILRENLKGLKNKRGTVKPIDITEHIRSNQHNVLEIIYVFAKVDYYLYCCVVDERTPEFLVDSIKGKEIISREETILYIKKLMNEEDEEFVTTSTVMSLQCPISYTRMRLPVKARKCDHLQCFDAYWFMHSQKQVPTWECPVCSREVYLEDLATSEYVLDILEKTDEDVEQVDIAVDGSWKVIREEDEPAPKATNSVVMKRSASSNEEDEELLHPTKKPTASNEPIVISLDSDSDENEDTDQNVSASFEEEPLSHLVHNSNPVDNASPVNDAGNTVQSERHLASTTNATSTNDNENNEINNDNNINNAVPAGIENGGGTNGPEPENSPLSDVQSNTPAAINRGESNSGSDTDDTVSSSPPRAATRLRRDSHNVSGNLLGLSGSQVQLPNDAAMSTQNGNTILTQSDNAETSNVNTVPGTLPETASKNPAAGEPTNRNGTATSTQTNGNGTTTTTETSAVEGEAETSRPSGTTTDATANSTPVLPPAHTTNQPIIERNILSKRTHEPQLVSPFIPKKPYAYLAARRRHPQKVSSVRPESADSSQMNTSSSEVIDLTSDD
ncbi:hypothetical protein RNJ44_05109 [Nakaseomyces bracarensis]|uniref:Uncharacterized protein n=1 Tax=Nakaseomyces bracarensis TaxID=273131 RepID=A0ABR4NX07_9SACH